MEDGKRGRSGDKRGPRRSLSIGFLEGTRTRWRVHLRGPAFETACWGGFRSGRKVGGWPGVKALQLFFRCYWQERDFPERRKFRKLGFGALKFSIKDSLEYSGGLIRNEYRCGRHASFSSHPR